MQCTCMLVWCLVSGFALWPASQRAKPDIPSCILQLASQVGMSKRQGSSLRNVLKKKKCSATYKFKPEWLDELTESELPTSSKIVKVKLGDIFIYREGTDDVICKLCQEAKAVNDFSSGKRWDDCKIDYSKRHITQKHRRRKVSSVGGPIGIPSPSLPSPSLSSLPSPPLPSPPSPSLPSLSHLPLPLPLEVGPLIAARGSGGAL